MIQPQSLRRQEIPYQELRDQFASIVGAGFVQVQEDVVIAAPANLDELARTLRTAHARGVTVSPYGGGTKQRWGYPDRSALRLETRRLNALREHTWQDMTCTVAAGCTWSELQAQLAAHGQFVALDPLWPDRATVGGIIASNDSGSLRHRYGGLRDLVIGMTLVLADGTIARTGGKVVKNVAGYDLHKLMTGAFGTLGLIAEVSFRLHALPQNTRTLSVAAPDASPLCELMRRLLDSQLSIQALQLASGSGRFHLNVQLTSLPEVLEKQAAALGTLAQELGLDTVAANAVAANALAADAAAADATVWNLRQELFETADSIVMKATLLASDIESFVTAVHTLGGRSVVQAAGVATAAIPAGASAAVATLRQRLEAGHGSLTVLQQPAPAELDPWGTAPDSLPLMRELKRRFDPTCILNAGRFLGGI